MLVAHGSGDPRFALVVEDIAGQVRTLAPQVALELRLRLARRAMVKAVRRSARQTLDTLRSRESPNRSTQSASLESAIQSASLL